MNNPIDRLKEGPKTLEAKWLDPECWDGCQSLVYKQRAEKAEAVRDEYVQRAIETTRELSAALKRAEKAEAACAKKDEILGSLESDIDSALQKECLCASISSEHGCPSCDAFTRIFRKANHALSLDCGKGYIPASELDKTIVLFKTLIKKAEFIAVSQVEMPMGWDEARTELARLESLQKSERKERCTICGNDVTDWVDPDWAKGRVCRPCESLRREQS